MGDSDDSSVSTDDPTPVSPKYPAWFGSDVETSLHDILKEYCCDKCPKEGINATVCGVTRVLKAPKCYKKLPWTSLATKQRQKVNKFWKYALSENDRKEAVAIARSISQSTPRQRHEEEEEEEGEDEDGEEGDGDGAQLRR